MTKSKSNLVADYEFDSVCNIDPTLFSEKKLIIFDVDNTLVFPETCKTSDKILSWFKNFSQTHKCVCVSNSLTRFKRKQELSNLLGCEVFTSRKKKPSKKLFREIQKYYKVNSKDIVVIGDRVFSDILFGNRNKATTVLVKPITSKERFLIKIGRVFDNVLLRIFSSHRKLS